MTPFRSFAASALLTVITAQAAPVGYLTPRPAHAIADSPWGIQAGDDQRLDLFDHAGALGVKWTRLMVNWGRVESQAQRYDFTDVDAMVDASLKAGVRPFLCLTGGNKLYSEPIPHPDPNWRLIYGVKPAPPILDVEATAAWLAFVDATLTHFRDRVAHWEIWNEPNHYAYWGAKPNAADYGRLVRVTAERIRAAHPESRIIAGSLAGIDARFITDFLAEDTGKLVNIVSFHNYANLPEARIYLADDTWAALDAHQPGLELWQGECGYASTSSTKDFRGTSPWGEIVQAKWLLRQALIDTFYMRATLSNYFKLFDGGDRSAQQVRPEPKPVDRILGFPAEPTGRRVRGVGVNEKCLLANPDLTPKPAYYAYQNLITAFGSGYAALPVAARPAITVVEDGQFQGISLDDAYPSVPLTAAYRRADGATLIAWWLPWQPQEYTPRPARAALRVKSHFADPVLVNPLDGSVQPVAVTREGPDTVFASVPLFDFPLLIAERSTLVLQPQPATPYHDAIPRL
jgi:hypothetical protein